MSLFPLIAIIDSGISHSADLPIKGKISFECQGDNIYKSNDAEDMLGHGTAVASLIHSYNNNIEMYIIKIFDNCDTTLECLYFEAIRYCIDTVHPNIIHLSCGMTFCENIIEFRDLCNSAEEAGIIIVAAYDNFGAISYPAAFNSVLGCDVDKKLKKEIVSTGRDDVNFLVPNKTYRLKWKNNSYFTSSGTSFNICMLTAKIAELIDSGINKKREIVSCFPRIDGYTDYKSSDPITNNAPKINKAIVFPYNKEIQSLIRHYDLLEFIINAVYDTKYNRHIGERPEKTIQVPLLNNMPPIRSFEMIDWNDDFDTFILGYVDELIISSGFDYLSIVINNCLKYQKSLFSFGKIHGYKQLEGEFSKKNLKLYVPQITPEDVPNTFRNKLRMIGIPIIGVFGTSSMQGKYSVQLAMRRYFIGCGYKVGQIGSEPSSELFGMDFVFPYGYDSTVSISGEDTIKVLNQMLGRIEERSPDLIIVGGQSQTVPQQFGNLSLYLLQQHYYVLGTNPDIIVLCVNAFDEDNYILRTINYLESIIITKVVALVLFPFGKKIIDGIMTNENIIIPANDLEKIKKHIESISGKKVYVLGQGITDLCEACLDSFV